MHQARRDRRPLRRAVLMEKKQEQTETGGRPKLMLINGGRVGRPVRRDRFI